MIAAINRGVLRAALVIVMAAVAAALAALFWWPRPADQAGGSPFAELLRSDDTGGDEAALADDAAKVRIDAFCGDCHAVPRPSSFPRYAWHKEVRAGYEFYAKSGRTDLDPPPMAETVAYYRRHAPVTLTFPDPQDADQPLSVTFQVDKRKPDAAQRVAPAVSHLNWLQLGPDSPKVLVASDMRRGSVMAVNLHNTADPPELLAKLRHPCHAEQCDLDGNGTLDLLVADLGSFPPGDHLLGRVVWLSRRVDEDAYDPIVIASGLGRVADARPADFDGDGDLDVIVAVFGMERTGGIVLLRNVAARGEVCRFELETLDPRPGGIHVPPVDLTGDGYPDFVALISQEHEQVAVFVNQLGTNQRKGAFHVQSLWDGPDLTYGSSGIELTDLDGDGDVDILYTNGDAFDNGFVNPSHGVQWLENEGQLKFTFHRLADLTGAYAASAGDLDLDGDLDIVAVAWLPGGAKPDNVYDKPLASVICLEQVAPGRFVRHTLERDETFHAAMELADFDDDGDLDLAVGFHSLSRTEPAPYWLAVWWNQLRSPAQ